MIPVPRSIARIPILRGLFRVGLTSWARWTRGRYMVDERMGLRLLLDHDNIVDRGIFLTGTWEKEHLDALFGLMAEQRRHFDGEAVFLDVGAHWGLYALLAHRSGLFKRIIAVEPDPVNYAQLQANLFLNGAEHAIEALKVAASDRARTFGLYRRTEVNRGGTRVVEEAQANQVTCHAVRLDDELDISGKLLVIKMDVESHEIEAIDGMLGLLSRNRCVIHLEICDEPEEEGPRRFRHFEELFGRYGIKYVRSMVADPLLCVTGGFVARPYLSNAAPQRPRAMQRSPRSSDTERPAVNASRRCYIRSASSDTMTHQRRGEKQ